MLKLGLSESALAARKSGIGASEARIVVHGTAEDRYRLWQEKVGEKKPRKIMSEWQAALRFATETLQLDWFEHACPGSSITRRGEMVWATGDWSFMFCTLDGVANDFSLADQPGLFFKGIPIDCKHVSRWTQEARDWCIEHYTAQMTHQAVVLGVDFGLLSLIHGEKEPEIIRIDCDPFYAGELIEREQEFWQACVDGVPPPDCATLDAPKVATPVAKLRTVNLNDEHRASWPNWAVEMNTYIGDFQRTHAAATAHALTRESIKELLPEDVGLVTRENVTVTRAKNGAVTIALKKEK